MRSHNTNNDWIGVRLARAHLLRFLRERKRLDFLCGQVFDLVIIAQHENDLVFFDHAISELPYFSKVQPERNIQTFLGKAPIKSKNIWLEMNEIDSSKQNIFLAYARFAVPNFILENADEIMAVTLDLNMCEAVAHEFMTTPSHFLEFTALSKLSLSTISCLIKSNWSDIDIKRKLNRLCSLSSVSDNTDSKQNTDLNLDKLAGYGAAANWGKLLAEDLRQYKAGQLPWRDIDRGVLLSGPPGVGKTLFGQALANTCNVPFYPHSLAQWQARGSLDDLLKAMRKAFNEASHNAPAILFLDEIDSFGNRASLSVKNENYSRQVINGLLECLDGVSQREGVIVVAATNMPDGLDPAIIRSGRIETHIPIGLPTNAERDGILRFHLGNDLPNADITEVANGLHGFTGADIAKFVRQARRRARAQRSSLQLSDLQALLPPKLSLRPDEIHRLAVHEAGHTVVAQQLSDTLGMTPVSAMINRDVVGGPFKAGVKTLKIQSNKVIKTKETYEAEICSFLAGLVAEQVILGSYANGGGGQPDSDLARATEIAIRMEVSLGLGSNLSYWVSCQKCTPDLLRQNSQLQIDVNSTLSACFVMAVEIIKHRRRAVLAVTAGLEKHGAINGRRLSRALGHTGNQALCNPIASNNAFTE